MEHKLKIGITHGDINGVGYEVILKTLSDPRIVELCTPVVYGSSKVAAYHRKALDLSPFNFNIITSAEQCAAGKINMINCFDDELKVELSKPSAQAGEAAFLALEAATADLQAGLIDAIVTAPINKHTIQSDKFDFPGHTEYFEKKTGNGQKSLMILLNDLIRVALVTTHLPLSKVPSMITRENILEKLTIFNRSLHEDFRIEKPRIAVLSLNPHAGEDGLLGTEEKEIIIPTLKEAENQGILCFGPYAADGFFGSGLRPIRRSIGHVPRSRVGTIQNIGNGRRGKLHCRTAYRAHLPGSRYSIRYYRTEQSLGRIFPTCSLSGDRCYEQSCTTCCRPRQSSPQTILRQKRRQRGPRSQRSRERRLSITLL